MDNGFVQSLSEEELVPRRDTVNCVVLLIEFLAVSPTGDTSACILHQIRFDLGRLPPVLQDRQLSRILQRNWAKRLSHRLSQETYHYSY